MLKPLSKKEKESLRMERFLNSIMEMKKHKANIKLKYGYASRDNGKVKKGKPLSQELLNLIPLLNKKEADILLNEV